jgi:elongation of very long chain fatty acids protein 4
MMYSYYTLSLLKFSCPWKKYLTQAQLLQFTTVVIYSLFSAKIVTEKGADRKLVSAIAVQVFEMVSLLVLFMHFYSNVYSKKKGRGKKSTAESDSNSDEMPEHSSVSSDSTTGDAKKDS